MRESRREGGKNRRNRDEPEAVRRRAVNEPSSSEPATSSWSLIASRAELDLSLRSRPFQRDAIKLSWVILLMESPKMLVYSWK
jgi:hypothetical protein